MPDIVVRHIDELTAERIKALARERRWSINDVILHALRYGLGMGGDAFTDRQVEFRSIAHLSGTWDSNEAAAFQEAIDALAATEPEQLANAKA